MSEFMPNQGKEPALEILKSSAMTLNNIYLKGVGQDLNGMNNEIAPGTYNDVNGVVVFNIGGTAYAMPSNDRTEQYLKDAEMRKDESIGVPHLNDAEVWGSSSEREQSDSFKEWIRLSHK